MIWVADKSPDGMQLFLDREFVLEHSPMNPVSDVPSIPSRRKPSAEPEGACPVNKKARNDGGGSGEIPLDETTPGSSGHGSAQSPDSSSHHDLSSDGSASKGPPAEPSFRTWLRPDEERNVPSIAPEPELCPLVPPMPLLTDLATIFKIHGSGPYVKKDRKPTKSDHSAWHTLETLGDGIILFLLRRSLLALFGIEMNLGFLKLFEDHAKSNRCLEQLAKDYQLNTRVAKVPPLERKLANFFEVWIGSIYQEQCLWYEHPFKQLEDFFGRLWELRYRVLRPYMQPQGGYCWGHWPDDDKKGDVDVVCTEIYYPDSPLFDQCRLNFSGVTKRSIGFVAKATYTTLSGAEQSHIEVFDSNESRARNLARRLVRSSSSRGTNP